MYENGEDKAGIIGIIILIIIVFIIFPMACGKYKSEPKYLPNASYQYDGHL